MVVSIEGRDQAKVMYGQSKLECVIIYFNLGMVFSSDGRWKQGSNRRMQAGRAALSSVNRHMVWNKNISINVKKVVFQTRWSLRWCMGVKCERQPKEKQQGLKQFGMTFWDGCVGIQERIGCMWKTWGCKLVWNPSKTVCVVRGLNGEAVWSEWVVSLQILWW